VTRSIARVTTDTPQRFAQQLVRFGERQGLSVTWESDAST